MRRLWYCVAHPLTGRYGLGVKMTYVLANKASKNQMHYAFESSFNIDSIEYKRFVLTTFNKIIKVIS